MHSTSESSEKPHALTLLASERPRDVGWFQAAGFLFGDWGTSRLYVLGLALFFAGRTSFWLIVAMSLLIFAVGWAYTQICRIYPDGGGVYTAAKQTSRVLAVVGALLLFADYTVTASLSVLDAFHYFGLGKHEQVDQAKGNVRVASGHYDKNPNIDAGTMLDPSRKTPDADAEDKDTKDKTTKAETGEKLLAWNSPGLWAIVAIAAIGLFNLMGPKHTSGFAIVAAVGMIFITLLITAFAMPKVPWHDLPQRIGRPDFSHTGQLWVAFVSIVLALSGVEAIANLTGVMKRPVSVTAGKAIWAVATEVAVFNIVLAIAMLAIFPINRDGHLEDMAAFLTGQYVGQWGELLVRIVGGLLLLSAGNTAISGMISIQYLMARDGELPAPMVKLNRFGVPWVPAAIAASVPIIVLLISHNLDQLASLYAIGVIGAVSINVSLCVVHPRLRRLRRKIPMLILAIVLLGIWVTLAYVKREALLFVTVVMVVGLTARQFNKWFSQRKGPRPSLLRQAIMQQLVGDALLRPRILVGTYGSEALARPALLEAKKAGATLVVCFIRSVRLAYSWDRILSMDTDLAALKVFAKFLDLGHQMGVAILPVYDSGGDAVELIAEAAAMNGCDRILLGTSRQGAFFQFIKGNFQKRLEEMLPPEIKVEVIRPEVPGEAVPTPVPVPASVPGHSG
ncbi:MAG TPA: amino acid permease [Tepidisphaeraceae bacterium]|nr:amino acid permease [Tepidisphaeraceae bacterium]